ncbi:MAG: CopG family transcriptional regulator [Verrucomicrobiae bacterium]|nr:CopG family transcriptional regulator [Verrucomicrobiae bacterium]
MRTTVTLDDDVFEAARAQAQASGRKLGEVLSQLARRGLRASAQGATPGGLPVFKVGPDADIIPGSRARDLLAEEAT